MNCRVLSVDCKQTFRSWTRLLAGLALLGFCGTGPMLHAAPVTIWPTNSVPNLVDAGDTSGVELGVHFRSDVIGQITGLRFYKAAANTGTHVGHLWNASGTLLASVTFSNETASGWQKANFAVPVTINSNTLYVASYYAPNGHYSADIGTFTNAVITSPLRAPGTNEVSNGLYAYTATPTGAFPNNASPNAANYWVDVVFDVGLDAVAPTVASINPTNGAKDVSLVASVSAVFSEDMRASSINTSNFTLVDAASNSVAATVSYDAATFKATLQPNSGLALGQAYTARLKSGGTGVKDLAGNALAVDRVWSFTATSNLTVTLWPDTTTPANVTFDPGDTNPYEFGVKFQSDVSGVVTGVRFYKGPANTGEHTGSLWASTGELLATATFTGETASGWQRVEFTNAIPISADTTYVASYFAPVGGYSVDLASDPGSLSAGVTNLPLRAVPDAESPNGVYTQSATSTFPSTGANGINWWVDVMFVRTPDTNPPTVVSVFPTNGATNVSLTTPVTVTFSEGMLLSSINTNTVRLFNASSSLIPASVSYDAGTRTATLQPSNTLAAGQTFTARVRNGINGVKDEATNALASEYVWSFTTQPPDTIAPTVLEVSPTNGATEVALTAAVQVTFSEAMNASLITTNTVTLVNAASNPVPANVSYDANTFTATLQPLDFLGGGQLHTARVKGTSTGVKDTAGNPLATDLVWSFTTTAAVASNLWGNDVIPDVGSFNDPGNYELGVKFRSALSGFIKGIRYYRGTNNPGPHTGNLWTLDGINLASVTFTNETTGGWQEQLFAMPVAVTSNVTYVASYHAPGGGYAVELGGFAGKGATNYPLRALPDGEDGGNGVYAVSPTSTFPTLGGGANYWVDVVFTDENNPPVAGTVNVTLPEDGSTNFNLVGSDVEGPVTFSLVNTPAHGTLSGFDTNTGAIAFAPFTNFFGPDTFKYRVSDGSLFATGTVNITVTGVDDPARAADQAISLAKDTATNLVLRATDIDSTNTVSNVLLALTNVTPNNWTLSAGATKAAAVSGNDGDTSYISSGGTANTQQQFSLVNPVHIQPGDVISSVTLRATARRASNPGGSFRLTAVLGASTALGTPYSTANTYADFTDAFTTRPGGGAWTLTDVQNLEARIHNTQDRSIACTRLDAVVSFVGNTNRIYTILSGPAHGSISGLSTNNGTLTYTPTTGYTGADSFTFRVNAGGVLSTGLVSITLIGTNTGPAVANPIGTQLGGYGTNFSFTFPINTFVDPDSPTLTYSATGMPPGINFTGGTRTFAGTPTASGNYPVSLVATDNSLPPLNATNTFTIAVAKAALTATARSTNKPYGVPFSFAGNEFTTAGLKFSDVVSGASLTSAGAPASAAAAAYSIVITNATGSATLTNYVIAYVNGTLTVNPSAPYAITAITITNGVATLTWQSITGRLYRLEYKDDLMLPAWTEVPVDIVGAGASTSTTNATGGTTNRFYRVK